MTRARIAATARAVLSGEPRLGILRPGSPGPLPQVKDQVGMELSRTSGCSINTKAKKRLKSPVSRCCREILSVHPMPPRRLSAPIGTLARASFASRTTAGGCSSRAWRAASRRPGACGRSWSSCGQGVMPLAVAASKGSGRRPIRASCIRDSGFDLARSATNSSVQTLAPPRKGAPGVSISRQPRQEPSPTRVPGAAPHDGAHLQPIADLVDPRSGAGNIEAPWLSVSAYVHPKSRSFRNQPGVSAFDPCR